jgi:hypothetical protein
MGMTRLFNGLSSHWHSVAIAGLISFSLLASGYALAAYRVHEARDLDARAHARLRAGEAALSKSKLAWDNLDATLRLAKRLRVVRLSGTLAVLQLTSIAERLPTGVWFDSFAISTDGLELAGQTRRLADLVRVSHIVTDVSPSTEMRSIARHAESDDLTFRMQQDDTRK